MQEIKYPRFIKGRILKIEMLEELRDLPRDALESFYEDLSDGIVCGLSPRVSQETITFSKGVIKYMGGLYVLSKPDTLHYGATEAEVMIKLTIYDETEDGDYCKRGIQIGIDTDMKIQENQMEIGRFKLKTGAYLRTAYQDLYDFTTEYNTVNIVHALHAGTWQPTLSGLVLKYFAREALAARAQNPLDIHFAMICLSGGRVEREVIQSYIAYKLEETARPLSNGEMHKKLVKILEQIKRESKGPKGRGIAVRKVIVD